MKNTFGNSISVTLFGESHGPKIGAVIDGLCPGLGVNYDFIRSQLDLRRPFGKISTHQCSTRILVYLSLPNAMVILSLGFTLVILLPAPSTT